MVRFEDSWDMVTLLCDKQKNILHCLTSEAIQRFTLFNKKVTIFNEGPEVTNNGNQQ